MPAENPDAALSPPWRKARLPNGVKGRHRVSVAISWPRLKQTSHDGFEAVDEGVIGRS
jgi:hypothetical protein